MPGKDMFIGGFISAFLERQNYFSSFLWWIIQFQSVIFSCSKRLCLLWEPLSHSSFGVFFLKKRGQCTLLSTQVKKIIVHELTLQISLVLMRCVCTHIKVKHSLFNIEEEIRCSKLLRSRATKGKILFLLMCRDHHLSIQQWPFFGDISSL